MGEGAAVPRGRSGDLSATAVDPVIFRQDVPSRYRAPVSPSRRLARSALPRERFRSLTHSGSRATDSIILSAMESTPDGTSMSSTRSV